MESIKREKYLYLALLIGLTMVFFFMLPRLLDPYSLEEDFRNWYWMHRFQDPTLFPNDYWIERNVFEVTFGFATLLIYKSSPLYGLLYQLGSNFLPVILLGKLQAFPLTVIAVFYLYRISERFVPAKTAMITCIFFVLLNFVLSSLVSMTGGFQRSFVLPLLLAFIYYWLQRKFHYVAVMLFLAAGLYPPLFVLLFITCILELILSWWSVRHTPERRHYSRYMGGLLVLGGIISLLLWSITIDMMTRISVSDVTDNWSLLSENSQYAPGGRASLFYIFPYVGRGGIADQGLTIIIIMFLALFAILISFWQLQRVRDFPRVFKSLFWSSWIAFALAWSGYFLTASFPLYLPSRYTQSSLLLILFIFVMSHAPAALQAAARMMTAHTVSLRWLSAPIAGFLLILFFFVPEPAEGVLAFGRGSSRWLFLILAAVLLILTTLMRWRPEPKPLFSSSNIDSRTQRIAIGLLILAGTIIVWALQPYMNITVKYHKATDTQQAMYTYIQTLPKDTLFAGSPSVSDSIPMFGKRRVLLTLELLGPDDTTITDALLAYYAEDPIDLLNFCRKYGVNYLVVNTNEFINAGEVGRAYFYEPYQSIIAPIIAQRSRFLLETLPDSVKGFQQDHLYIAACIEESIRP
jgi:hypothetical protein